LAAVIGYSESGNNEIGRKNLIRDMEEKIYL
jgi:hypothetical protein